MPSCIYRQPLYTVPRVINLANQVMPHVGIQEAAPLQWAVPRSTTRSIVEQKRSVDNQAKLLVDRCVPFSITLSSHDIELSFTK